MKHLLALAALLALSSPVVAQDAKQDPAPASAEAVAPASPAEQPPVILFRQVSEFPIRPKEVEVDGTVSCTLVDEVLRCTARRPAPAQAPEPVIEESE